MRTTSTYIWLNATCSCASICCYVRPGLRQFYRNINSGRGSLLPMCRVYQKLPCGVSLGRSPLLSSADELAVVQIALQNTPTPADQVNDQDD